MNTRPCFCRIFFVALTFASALSLFEMPMRAADWPQFRGPGGLAISPDKHPPVTWSQDKNLRWKTRLPGPGTSSPILIGDRIFLTCFTGSGDALKLHLLRLNRDTGQVEWDKSVAPELPEQDRIREDHGYASSTPVADNDRVYVFFGKTGVLAFSHDGRELWRATAGSRLHGWGSATSPVLYQDLVIVNASVESESLIAFDKKTGRKVWTAEGIKESWNTPLLVPLPDGKTELVVAVFGKVLGLDPATGKQLWQCDTGIGWYMCPSATAHNGIVYVIGGRTGGALAVRAGGQGDVTGTHRSWQINKGSNVSSPVYHAGHLYFTHENIGVITCVDASNGHVVFEERLQPASGQIYSSTVLAAGKLYFVARRGGVYVVEAKPVFEQLAHNSLGDRSTFNATPAVSGDQLFLRSDQFLYCIGQ